jgi:hypothetical protein
MATTTTNFGWDIPQSTDLVKDGATAIAALGQDIDTALVDLKGGTTGQVLAKATNTDLDFSWVTQDDANAIQNAQLTAKGALISAFSAGSPATLTVGSNDQVLTADSTTATGLKWAAAAGGGDLTRITKVTVSSSATVNINNCFSSTYDYYLIQSKFAHTAGTVRLYYRMRSSGTDNTSATYSSVNFYNTYSNTAPLSDASANATEGQIGFFHSTDEACDNIDIRNPFAAQHTSLFNAEQDSTSMGMWSAVHKTKSSFDGISLYVTSGTLTGEINIYGYKKG